MADPLPRGTVLAERFRVERLVGEGGMGAVYEVEHIHTRHRRALKLLNARYAEDRAAVDRFLREASVAGRIGHPHLVETFDAGWLPTGEPYVLMELLSGSSLEDRIHEGPLPVALACQVLAEVAEALAAAHEAGVVHRDLKPANLFLVKHDGRPFAKVLDFGISKFDARHTEALQATSEGIVMGTPLYMSPEQIQGKELDARSDLYSLGVILFECLSGLHPYPARSLPELVHKIVNEPAPPLRDKAPSAPQALAALTAQLLEKSPAERPQTAAEVARVLRTAAARAVTDVDELGETAATLPPQLAERPSAAPALSALVPAETHLPSKSPREGASTQVSPGARGRTPSARWAALGLLGVGGLAAGAIALSRETPREGATSATVWAPRPSGAPEVRPAGTGEASAPAPPASTPSARPAQPPPVSPPSAAPLAGSAPSLRSAAPKATAKPNPTGLAKGDEWPGK